MRSRAVLIFAAFCAFIGVAYACGGSNDASINGASSDAGSAKDSASSADGGGTTIDGANACADYTAARCARFDACTNGMYTTLRYGSAAECRSRELLTCQNALLAPDNTATPTFFEACARAIPAEACHDFFDNTSVPTACIAIAGTRDDGAACTNSGQCKSAWCRTSTSQPCGTCTERPTVGAACAVNADCGERGLVCSVAGTCAEPVFSGGSCDDADPCEFGTSCVGQAKTGTGTCDPEGTSAGATCDDRRANGPGCEFNDALYCPLGGLCEASALVGPGAPCGRIDQDAGVPDAAAPYAFAQCSAGAMCEPPGAAGGICAAAANDGAACDRAIGPPCLPPARCVTKSDASTAGTCQILSGTACN